MLTAAPVVCFTACILVNADKWVHKSTAVKCILSKIKEQPSDLPCSQFIGLNDEYKNMITSAFAYYANTFSVMTIKPMECVITH